MTSLMKFLPDVRGAKAAAGRAVRARLRFSRASGEVVEDHSQTPPLFIPIRLVTILEVFTRDWVTEIIDSGEPYTSRAADIVKGSLKIDFALAQALVGKQLTFGEPGGARHPS